MVETNNLTQVREDKMMSKSELARACSLSVLTIARVEKGFACRPATKRKILNALGISLEDKRTVWPHL